MASYSIVGVVGHIDHGKTSLVGCLTGTDTDTHPEEKQRGITIDLGFASFHDGDDVFAMIDAPGHQKYIGNLLAGVCQVDIGLMVVAADQGIQAQTLEHAGILRALGVERLIVAISRIDLCTDDQVETLREELELFLADEGFEEFPIVAVSVVSGEGIESLKGELRDAIPDTQRDVDGPFRMPIDRVFSVPGRGCVVAGTIWSGKVVDGDSVKLAGGPNVRVREIETHGEARDQSVVGYRTAMNVVGASAKDIRRGDELVADDRLSPVNRLVVELQVRSHCPEIRCPATCQIHTAATSCEARITGVKRLTADQHTSVILETSEPVVATFGQHCLFRRPYPVGSFASGKVLAAIPDGQAVGKKMAQFSKQLFQANELDRFVAWVELLGTLTIDMPWLPLQLGVHPEQISQLRDRAIEDGKCEELAPGTVASKRLLDGMQKQILSILKRQADQSENAWIKSASLIEQVSDGGSSLSGELAIKSLLASKDIVTTNNMLALATDATQLSKKQLNRLNEILRLLRGNRTPPTRKNLSDEIGVSRDQAESLIRFATQQGLLVDVGKDFSFDVHVIDEFRRELSDLFDEQSELTVADIRDHWGLTRKHVVPLLEFFDQMKFTVRSDTVRTAGQALVAE